MRELRAIRIAEPHEERWVCGILELRRVTLDRAHRGTGIQADRDRVLRPVDLNADVVAGLVVPGGLERTDPATAEPQDDRGRRDIAPLVVLRKAQSGSRRVKVLDLVAEHPARHVEIVNELVDELAAGCLDVGVGWR